MITNDIKYTKKAKIGSKSEAFSIGNNEKKQGLLKWKENSSVYKKKHRETSILLANQYIMNWDNYSDLRNGSYSKFYVLTNKVYKDCD